MEKRNSKHCKPAGRLILAEVQRSKVAAAPWVAAAFVVLLGLAASAKDTLLHGYVTVDRDGWLVIREAREVSDREEAISHGYWRPGDDPRRAVMHGYVAPGMTQEQAAREYRNLPHLPSMPGPTTDEDIDRMAGMPADPMPILPDGETPSRIRAGNEKQFYAYMREKFGPVSVPPLHRNHNVLPSTVKTMKLVHDHSGSIREMTDASGNIVYSQTFDPYGNGTFLGGSGPQPDFGYQGYYVHQRSGLNLATHRAYSPTLGRWLSRDPIEDPTFRMTPREPQTPDPYSMAQMTPAMEMVTKVTPQAGSNQPDSNNPYVYVLNDPINRADPSGLKADKTYCCPCPKNCDNPYNVAIPDWCTCAERTGRNPQGQTVTYTTIYFTTPTGGIYQAVTYGDWQNRQKQGLPTCYWQKTQ